MNGLISITEREGKQVVSARELHEFLQAGSNVNTWFKNQVERAMLIEDEDFVCFQISESESRGGQNKLDYAITINAAKEIAMLNGGEKGKQARLYFIEVEKKYKANSIDFTNPDTVLMLAQNWKKSEEERKRLLAINEQKEKQIQVLSPKAALMDRVMDSGNMIDIGQAAKVLGLPFGRNTLFQKLREKGIFFKNRNEPLQLYVDNGCFVLKQKEIERNFGPFVVIKVLVTQKGLAYLARVFQVTNQPKELMSIQ